MKKLFAFLVMTMLAFATGYSQTIYDQGFETNNSGWDVFGGTFDATRVASGNNGVTSKSGSFHGEAAGSGIGGTEASSAATNWGGYSSTFPADGYISRVEIYLDMAATTTNDTRFDFSSAINNPSGSHRRDFVFNAGFYNDSDVTGTGPRFVVSASNNAGRANSFPKNPGRDPFAITATGWYTFQHKFYDAGGGVLASELSIINASGTTIKTWTLSDPTDIIGSTVGGNRYGWFVNVEFSFLAIDDSQLIYTQVNDVQVTVAPSSLNGWGSAVETGAGTLEFVTGPGTPPLNTGSAEFFLVDATSGVILGTPAYTGTRLDEILQLQYSTYNTVGNNTVAPALQINIDYDLSDGTTSWQGRLVFEPYYDNTIIDGTWQTWDPRAGRWWQSGTPIVGDVPQPKLFPISSPGSWNDILAAYPDAGVQTGALSGVLFKAGSGWLAGYQGSVDEFIIQVNDTRTTFDFEPDPVKPYVILANENVKFDGTLLSGGDIHSNGDITFENDEKGTHTGNLSAVDKITIEEGVTIDGDAIAGDRIYEFGDITGSVDEFASVAAIPLPVLNFTAGGPDKTVPAKGSLNLPPGIYGKVKVEKKARLILSAGDYFVDELDTDDLARIVVDVSGGPVNINVVDEMEIDDEVKIVLVPNGDSDSNLLTFSTMQDNKVDIGKYTTVFGNIIAPDAEVHFSGGSRFRGTVCADKVTVEEGVPFLHHDSPVSLPKRDVPELTLEGIDAIPTAFSLSQNYPNPFNPSTTIRFALPEVSQATLTIYNMTGQLVRTLVTGEMPAGTHSAIWDATDDNGHRVASGVYLYVIRAGDFTSQRKLVLMK